MKKLLFALVIGLTACNNVDQVKIDQARKDSIFKNEAIHFTDSIGNAIQEMHLKSLEEAAK
jgi:hypothetical protein